MFRSRACTALRGQSIIGVAFYVMGHVEGRIFWEQTLPGCSRDERAALYDELNRTIAALHRLDPESIGLGDYGRHGDYFARQIARWTSQYDASRTIANAAMDRLIAWLPAHIPTEAGPVSLVHGDFRIDNVIFHPTRRVFLQSSIGSCLPWGIRWPISPIT